MNKQRQNEIKNEIRKLNNVIEVLNNILIDEEDYFDNIPDNLRGSIRAEDSEMAIEVLNEQIELLKEIANSLEDI